MKYRVVWNDINSGDSGFGSPVSYEIAAAWVEAMNEKFDYIHHTIEPCPKDENEESKS